MQSYIDQHLTTLSSMQLASLSSASGIMIVL